MRGGGPGRRRLGGSSLGERGRPGDRPDQGADAEHRPTGEDGGVDLRRRPGSDVDAAGLGGAREVPRARHVLRGRVVAWPATRIWSARSAPRARRSASTRSPTRTWPRCRRTGWTGRWPRPRYALAGATGEVSYLIRPPYSSEADALDDAGFGGDAAARAAGLRHRAGRRGQPGLGSARASTRSSQRGPAEDGHGGVVLLHDAGGDRARPSRRWTGSSRRCRPRASPSPPSARAAGLPAGGLRRDRRRAGARRVMLVAVAIARLVVGRPGVVPAVVRWARCCCGCC